MKPVTILLVEDERSFAIALKATLKRKCNFPIEVESAEWLSAALERLSTGGIDVVLLDLSLPDSNGIETLLKVRTHSTFLPVIVLTGREDDIALESLRLGAQDYLLKGSLDGDVLSRSIRYALERVHLIEQREEFIATLTHDLKNPIIAANRILQLIAEGGLDPVSQRQSELLMKLHNSNSHLLLMIENLLEVYRLEKDLNPIMRTHTNLLAIINHCIEAIEPIASNKSVVIERQLETPELVPLFDPEGLRRVVQNLLDNAVKFTPAGGVVTVRLRQDLSKLLLQVCDTGPGIPADEQCLLFERFGRGGVGKQHRHGTGLGLFLCKKLVEMHGGTISCHSDGGTTFNVELPLDTAVLAS